MTHSRIRAASHAGYKAGRLRGIWIDASPGEFLANAGTERWPYLKRFGGDEML